jgi:lysophospholipase L1-like esterase
MRVFVVLLSLLCCLLEAHSQHRLYMVAGQSNARGTGDYLLSESVGDYSQEYDYFFDTLKPLSDPVGDKALNFQESKTGSIVPSFVNSIYDCHKINTTIVHAARGGSSSLLWKNLLVNQSKTKLNRAQELTGLPLSGVIWIQGETDAFNIMQGASDLDLYRNNLLSIINSYEENGIQVPFYIVEIGPYPKNADTNTYFDSIRYVQHEVASSEENVFIAYDRTNLFSQLNLMQEDGIHYSQQGYNLIGRELGDTLTYLGSYPSDFVVKTSVDDTIQNSDSIVLHWQASIDIESINYEVVIRTNNGIIKYETSDTSVILNDIFQFTPNLEVKIWIEASDGILNTHSDTLDFSIDNIPPNDFLLKNTVNSEVNNSDTIVFSWEESQDIDSILYHLYIFSAVNDTLIDNISDTFSIFYDADFLWPNHEYSWYVVADDGRAQSVSDTGTFTIKNIKPAPFYLQVPSVDSILSYSSETHFQWNRTIDIEAIQYQVFISNDTLIQYSAKTDNNDYIISDISFLKPNGTFKWYVLASDGIDSTYSDTLLFFTENLPPEQFMNLNPSHNSSIDFNDTINFNWQEASDAETINYSIQIFNDSQDTSFFVGLDTFLICELSSFLIPNKSYNWRVYAADQFDTTTSSISSLNVRNVQPTEISITSTLPDSIRIFDSLNFSWNAAIDRETLFYNIHFYNTEFDTVFSVGYDTTVFFGNMLFLQPNQKFNYFISVNDLRDTVYSDTGSVQIRNELPFSAQLAYPESMSMVNELNDLEFGWFSSFDQEEVNYSFKLNGGDTIFSYNQLNDTVLTLTSALIPNTTYYWNVLTSDGISSVISDTSYFITGNLAPTDFKLLSPVGFSSVDLQNNEFLVWEKAKDIDAVTYHGVLIDINNNDTLIFQSDDTLYDFKSVNSILPNRTYKWYVKAIDHSDTTYSNSEIFSTDNIPPSEFSIVSESRVEIEQIEHFILSWSSSFDLDSINYSVLIYDKLDTIYRNTRDTVFVFNNAGSIFIRNVNYNVRIAAYDAYDTVFTEAIALLVNNSHPNKFNLVEPQTKLSSRLSDPVHFSWEKSVDYEPVFYNLYLWNENWDTLIANFDANNFMLSLPGTRFNQKYYWCVEASDFQDVVFSDTLSFYLENLAPTEFEITKPSQFSVFENVDSINVEWELSFDEDSILYTVHFLSDNVKKDYTTQKSSIVIYNTKSNSSRDELLIWVVATDGLNSTVSDTIKAFRAKNTSELPNEIVQLFPNPTNNPLSVINKSLQNYEVFILRTDGSVVLETYISTGYNSLYLNELVSGNYFIYIPVLDYVEQIIYTTQ